MKSDFSTTERAEYHAFLRGSPLRLDVFCERLHSGHGFRLELHSRRFDGRIAMARGGPGLGNNRDRARMPTGIVRQKPA